MEIGNPTDLGILKAIETLIGQRYWTDTGPKKKTGPVLDPAWIRIYFTIELLGKAGFILAEENSVFEKLGILFKTEFMTQLILMNT